MAPTRAGLLLAREIDSLGDGLRVRRRVAFEDVRAQPGVDLKVVDHVFLLVRLRPLAVRFRALAVELLALDRVDPRLDPRFVCREPRERELPPPDDDPPPAL